MAETIAQEATNWNADLIVVGSHGKGWVDRLLMGSTTERLLTFLPASVLVVPTGAALARATVRPRARGRGRVRPVRKRARV